MTVQTDDAYFSGINLATRAQDQILYKAEKTGIPQ
jgi:hypothetical protein